MAGRGNRLASAVRLALSLGAVATATTVPRTAFGQTTNSGGDAQGQVFDTIVVTGSNVRRVDTETANPVVTIDRATIERSGKLTLGDLLQDLPAVTGPYVNPRVNNGGGTGASTVSLRGLGAQRTLILVNGHRYQYGDVNAIPAASIERIEVLTDGASSVYGSDAIGGVVNFILRSSYQGAEFAADYGISDRDDGQRQGYHFVFGQTTDKGNLLAGVDYNKYESILAANRNFSNNLVYYYYGAAHVVGGSNHAPGGYIQLPPNLQQQFGCAVATLKAVGQISHPPSVSDFRCFDGATDGYNFQAYGNVELTPQERTSAFVTGSYKLGDNVEAYLEYFHNQTRSAFILAPLPIDTVGTQLVISAQSYFNPFGVEFSNDANVFRTRLTGNGDRFGDYSTQADQATAGFRGTITGTSWQWNAYFNYSHFTQLNHATGFLNLSRIGAATGPSYKDASGNIVCGTDPATGGTGPIADCVPLNLFDVTDPATIAATANFSGDTFIDVFYIERSVVGEVNGDVWTLPAGDLKLAAGVSYREQSGQTLPDAPLIPDEQGVCAIGTGCVAPVSGAYNVKEAYVELLVPVLKELPFASALNLIIGDRYSRYSNFGSTNNAKFAIEHRPIEDLLLRGTVSAVFRAPTISDLYQGNSQSGGHAVDPCFGLVGANAACVGVPGDGSFAPVPDLLTGNIDYFANSVITGAVPAGTPIGPEHGKSFDWGFVYDPHWLSGLSVSADLWRVYLNDVVGLLSLQSILDLCYLANGGPYCHLIHRSAAQGDQHAQIAYITDPVGNLGRLDVKGADMNAHYKLAETVLGRFTLNLQATYLDRYTDNLAPGLPGNLPQEYAGHETTGVSAIPYANFSRWKALGSINWNRGAWSAAWSLKYIGKFTVGYARLDYNDSACAFSAPAGCELKYGATVYHNLTAGYLLEAANTRVDVGIDNLGDKSPPFIYNNNAINGNVDPATFDTIGRFYWARLTMKF